MPREEESRGCEHSLHTVVSFQSSATCTCNDVIWKLTPFPRAGNTGMLDFQVSSSAPASQCLPVTAETLCMTTARSCSFWCHAAMPHGSAGGNSGTLQPGPVSASAPVAVVAQASTQQPLGCGIWVLFVEVPLQSATHPTAAELKAGSLGFSSQRQPSVGCLEGKLSHLASTHTAPGGAGWGQNGAAPSRSWSPGLGTELGKHPRMQLFPTTFSQPIPLPPAPAKEPIFNEHHRALLALLLCSTELQAHGVPLFPPIAAAGIAWFRSKLQFPPEDKKTSSFAVMFKN